MALEDIQRELEKRFDEPLDEFYKRRIIFWNDEEGEFKEEVFNLYLSNAKVMILDGSNLFECKRILSSSDLVSNYLVYNPLREDSEHDWLLDIKLFSEEYRADLTSRWLQEMHIVNNVDLRNIVKEYKGFFNASSRRSSIASFGGIEKKSTLYMSILSSICGIKERSAEAIIQAVIEAGVDIENTIKLDLLKYNASDLFWTMVEKTTGFHSSKNIDDLACYVVLSAMSRTLPSEVLSGLENRYEEGSSGFCYDLVTRWIEEDKDSFASVADYVTRSLKLNDRFNQFDIDKLLDTDVVPVIDEVILSKLIHAMVTHTIQIDSIQQILEKRKTSHWYDAYDYFYDAIEQVMNMLKFEETHRDSFHHTKAKEMWDFYTKDYYRMDEMYREFYLAYAKRLEHSYGIDDALSDLADEVEKEYKNWYLDKLASNWNSVIEKDLAETGRLPDIQQQTNFYSEVVSNANGKVFVIISDAMRFDVAKTLAKELELETKSDVSIEGRQGIFPTITPFGMAALLPHRDKLEAVNQNGSISVLIDGKPTGASYRDEILKSVKSKDSVAVKYKDLIEMKRIDRRELVKGKDVIYIYHDVIDEAGHTDTGIFEACLKAIKEIKNLVNIICNELNGLNVLITSDHGFLYTEKELEEADKMERADFKKDIIEQGRRYVITNKEAKPEFLMSVKGIYNKNDMLGFAPRENIRLKGSGSQKFVHGGISLQEMCVPVITYKFIRSGYKAYQMNKDKYDAKPVSVALLSSNRKISNMIFNLNFYQKDAVKDNLVPCTYITYIEDSNGQEVSDKQKIIADKTSTVLKDREFKCTFNLKSQKYNHNENYYLVIVDEEGKQVPTKEEIQIDIAMAIDDFDFFG